MAEPIYGSTFEEDFNARRMMLPQAIGAARPMQAQQGYDPEAQLMELVRQRSALEEQQPDVSALQEYARRQGEMGQGALLNALAAQYAGEGFQPLQAKFLKQAEASQQPMRVGGGMLTPSGEFVRDPFTAQERQAQMLDRRIGGLERVIESRQARQERAEQAARELDWRKSLGLANLGIRQEMLDLRRNPPGGGAAGNRFQQAGSYILDNGQVVSGVFSPDQGPGYMEGGRFVPLPPGARPTLRGAGAPLTANQYRDLREDIKVEQNALLRMNQYLSNFPSMNVGIRNLADRLSANAKTFLGAPDSVNRKELAAQLAQGQVQGLLGMLRVDVVGPGVMTEQDAKRVLSSIGGDVSVLQNPRVVENLLRQVFEQKQRRLDDLMEQDAYHSRFFPGMAPIDRTPIRFGEVRSGQPAAGGGQSEATRRIRLDANGNIIR